MHVHRKKCSRKLKNSNWNKKKIKQLSNKLQTSEKLKNNRRKVLLSLPEVGIPEILLKSHHLHQEVRLQRTETTIKSILLDLWMATRNNRIQRKIQITRKTRLKLMGMAQKVTMKKKRKSQRKKRNRRKMKDSKDSLWLSCCSKDGRLVKWHCCTISLVWRLLFLCSIQHLQCWRNIIFIQLWGKHKWSWYKLNCPY